MTQPSSSKLFREIVSAGKEFQIAVKIRDAAAVASFYTEDAQLLSPEQEFIVGRQAIQSFWQRICAAPIKGADLETVEVQGRGDTATEVSRFTLHGEHGPILERAEYMVVWRRVNGAWKLHRDGYKSSRRSVDPR